MKNKKTVVKFESHGLLVLQEALHKLHEGKYHIQVGIFGGKTARKKGEVTNAEVGYVHERGSRMRNIPQRSFLWDTFSEHGQEWMDAVQGDVLKLYKTGKIPEFLKRAGLFAENLVQKAFDTGGFGKWAPLSLGTLMAKAKGNVFKRMQQAAEDLYGGGHNVAILVKTGQLRRAIASRTAGGA